MLATFLSGLMLGFSLIVAIGAQNVFVLKQGILKQNVFWICLFCAVSDAVLIALGVFGFAPFFSQVPMLLAVMKYAGIAFLVVYGVLAFKRAFTGQQLILTEQQQKIPLSQSLALCFGFTWLNPHVYLDTVVLLGSISAQYVHKTLFALGAMFASLVFFFSLGYLARFLRPLFAQVLAWRILDSMIGIIMLCLAYALYFSKIT